MLFFLLQTLFIVDLEQAMSYRPVEIADFQPGDSILDGYSVSAAFLFVHKKRLSLSAPGLTSRHRILSDKIARIGLSKSCPSPSDKQFNP